MGPTNIALVKLYQADQALREAQARLDAAQKNVRVQERRVADLSEKTSAASAALRAGQANAARLDLEDKSRETHIERLREQQMTATNPKVYQTFLVEINTAKVDRGKIEDEALAVMEAVEKAQAELTQFNALLEAEQAKLVSMRTQIGQKVATLAAEVESLRPARDAAAAALPPRARHAFERLAEHHEGEAMAALAKPDRRREEYLCTSCNMNLVTDVYNKLHSRDELGLLPQLPQILYIPDDLPPEMAVHKPKETRKRETAAAKEPPPTKDAWTEEEFTTRVARADNPQLADHQRQLLDALRGGVAGLSARFNGQGAVNPAYNVYAEGAERHILRVNADGRIFAFWAAFSESGQPELTDYFRSVMDPLVLDAARESDPLAGSERNLASTDMPSLMTALRSLSEKIMERRAAVQDAASPA